MTVIGLVILVARVLKRVVALAAIKARRCHTCSTIPVFQAVVLDIPIWEALTVPLVDLNATPVRTVMLIFALNALL